MQKPSAAPKITKNLGVTNAVTAADDIHPDRHDTRHRGRLRLPRGLARQGDSDEISGYISLITDIFLRLIKMIIAPLVFSTLVVGVAHMGDPSDGRPDRRQGDALVRLRLAGVAAARAGAGRTSCGRATTSNLPLPDAGTATNLKVASLSLKDFVTHLVPRSIFEAMANNEILQIVVFSMFFGVACAALGERAHDGRRTGSRKSPRHPEDDRLHHAAGAARGVRLDGRDHHHPGLGILVTYGKFVIEFYLGLAAALVPAGRGRLR